MLSDAQTQKAIDYNKRRGYSDEEVKLIQRTVSTAEDGKWGPKTVNAVAEWQKNASLKADGMVGPATYEAIKNSWELCPTQPPEGLKVQVGCGLAAYDQQWPGHSTDEAMQVAWDQAIALGCTEIRFWSSEWLIDEDLVAGGNKGNKYSGPWLAKQKVPEGVVVGAWIDDHVSNASKQKFVEYLQQMHITRAAIMINRSNTRPGQVPWALRWDREQLERISNLYRAAGIDLVATCWPQPSRAQIDAMCADMEWILDVLETKTFEVDTEGNWKPRFASGFGSMTGAADYLAERMRDLVGPDGELELTTYTYHRENSKTAQLAPLMDRLLPQAYSVRHRGNETVGWNDNLGPGKHQVLAVNRALQAAAAR